MELETLGHLHVVLLELIEGELLVRDGDFVDLKLLFSSNLFVISDEFPQSIARVISERS